MSKNNTQDTIKDFIGDIADSTKKAFDEILDRKGDDSHSADWLTPGNPYQALNGLPGDVLRTVSALSALGGVANPVAALANAANAAVSLGAANPLAALVGAAPNPLAALGGGAPNPLAALAGGGANPLGALGGANPLGALGQVVSRGGLGRLGRGRHGGRPGRAAPADRPALRARRLPGERAGGRPGVVSRHGGRRAGTGGEEERLSRR
ncbi:hypothetical protein HEP87_45170 [Streptomyces sp. S1D4-11]